MILVTGLKLHGAASGNPTRFGAQKPCRLNSSFALFVKSLQCCMEKPGQ